MFYEMVLVKVLFGLIMVSQIHGEKDGVLDNITETFDPNGLYAIRKCCDEGEILNLTTKRCSPYSDMNLFNSSFLNIIHVSEKQICSKGKFKVNIGGHFFIDNGSLIWNDLQFNMEDFCLFPTNNKTYAIICVINEEVIAETAIGGLG